MRAGGEPQELVNGEREEQQPPPVEGSVPFPTYIYNFLKLVGIVTKPGDLCRLICFPGKRKKPVER